MVRSFEQILGAQPLNQKRAAATPMIDAFTTRPDLTPYSAVLNRAPLTEAATAAPTRGYDTLGLTGAAANAVNADSVNADAVKTAVIPEPDKATAAQWQKRSEKQHFVRTARQDAVPDSDNPELMNR